jgi:hypothetical protein
MLSADRGENMSGIERFLAAIFLAGAVAGAAAFGHLLGNEQSAVPSAASLSPALSTSPSVAIEATPAPPLPSMFPMHLPSPVVAKALRTTPAPAVRLTVQPPAAPKPIVISRIVTRPPQPRPAPVPAKAAPAPVAAPAPAPPAAPVAAPATPAPVDVQVVLAATEQVVAPPTDEGQDENDDGHQDWARRGPGNDGGGHDWRGGSDRRGGNDGHGEHGQGDDD